MNLREAASEQSGQKTSGTDQLAIRRAAVLKTATGPSRPNRIRTFEQFGILTSPAARSKTQELENATRQAMHVQRNNKARLRNIVAV